MTLQNEKSILHGCYKRLKNFIRCLVRSLDKCLMLVLLKSYKSLPLMSNKKFNSPEDR